MVKEGDNESTILRDDANARLAVAQNKSTALIKEAQAESSQQGAMEGTRRHDEKMALAASMEGLAEHGKFVVSGKNGQTMLSFFGDAIE